MGKKYLETKNDSLESAVLGVWQTAIEEADGRMDGRTKQYKSHRSKLEAARLRRGERNLNKEEVELNEKVEYVEYKFKSPRDAIAAKKYFEAQQRMEFEVYGSHRDGELTVDAGKNDMAEYHRVIMQKYKPKVVTSEQKKNLKKDDEDEDENPVGKSYNEAVVGKDALDAIYDIVNKKQHGKVLGVKVDLFTASAMQKVYQALNDKNKDKVEKMLKDKRGVMTFAQFAMSQVK